MKESITKFDLESAFKALDEIEIPKAAKVRANKPALTEIFSRKSKFDALMEEYYDIGSNAGLEDAKEARDAEIAQAKLARIEKIVDLEADSAEDLLTSYVGKLIIQCPQCMTLFYKNQEDIVASEDDPSTVNVNEVCQHCGNESGYSLIGKVGEAEPETEEPTSEESPEEDINLDEVEEETTEESSEEDLNFDDELEELDLELDEEPAEEEEKKEESFSVSTGEVLVEELTDDKELDDKLEAHNEYIEYLRAAIAQEEEKLEKATNEQVKVAIQRNIDAFKADLENALPEAVKNDKAIQEEPTEETEKTEVSKDTVEETVEESLTEGFADYVAIIDRMGTDKYKAIMKAFLEANKELDTNPKYLKGGKYRYFHHKNMPIDLQADFIYELIVKAQEKVGGSFEDIFDAFEIILAKTCAPEALELVDDKLCQLFDSQKETAKGDALTEALHEEAEVSDEEFEQLINSSEFKKPISDTAVRAMLDAEKPKDSEEKETTTEALNEEMIAKETTKVEEASEEEEIEEALEEGIFDTLKNKASIAAGRLKDKATELKDKAIGKTMLREEKADWLLANTFEKDGKTKKYKTFVVIGFTDTDARGKELEKAPAYNNADLVPEESSIKAKATYKDAEDAAKGWSLKQDNGPAFIYLAKDIKDKNAAFLCQYFKGKLVAEQDQLEKYFKAIQDDIKGDKLENRSDFQETPAKNLKPGMQLKLKDKAAEVVKIEESDLGEDSLSLTVKFEDGTSKTYDIAGSMKFSVVKAATTESLDSIFNDLEELKESSLEHLISDSLIEAYGNVAGFRLKNCSYADNKFLVEGTIHFTSGNRRNTTYTFTEAFIEANKVILTGLNEKLGADKRFTMVGFIEPTTKTLITESFKRN